MAEENKAFGDKLGGLLLVFVVGCCAYIVLYPIGMVAGVSLGLVPAPHPAVAACMVIMELAIIAIAFLILRRDKRFIYAYVAGAVACVALCVVQAAVGAATWEMTLVTIVFSLIGAALLIVYFLRSRRVQAYIG